MPPMRPLVVAVERYDRRVLACYLLDPLRLSAIKTVRTPRYRSCTAARTPPPQSVAVAGCVAYQSISSPELVFVFSDLLVNLDTWRFYPESVFVFSELLANLDTRRFYPELVFVIF